MEKSSSLKQIGTALSQFRAEMEPVKKDADNPFFKSKYASLDNILDAIREPLQRAGLTFTQFPDGANGLTTILIHSASGEYIESRYEMQPTKNDPQGVGSAITYMRRYALGAVLGLATEVDDDANSASTVKSVKGKAKTEEVPAEGDPFP